MMLRHSITPTRGPPNDDSAEMRRTNTLPLKKSNSGVSLIYTVEEVVKDDSGVFDCLLSSIDENESVEE